MAGFAVGHATVNGRVGLARCRRERAGVASRALAGDVHAAVKLRWRPSSESALVAGITVCARSARDVLVGNVVGRSTIRRRESAAVAGRALPGNGALRVIEPGRLPGSLLRIMAAEAVHGGGHVRTRLACRLAAIVASGTGCRRRHGVVIHLAGPVGGRVAGLAASVGLNVIGRLAGRRWERSCMTRRALPGNGHIAVELGGRPGVESALVAGIAVRARSARNVLVRNMVRRSTVGRRERATMTGRALVCDRRLSVVELGRLPS